MRIIHFIDHLLAPQLGRHQQLDASLLEPDHQVETWVARAETVVSGDESFRFKDVAGLLSNRGADLLHVYSASDASIRRLGSVGVPWIAPSPAPRGWIPFFQPPHPHRIISPHPAFGDRDPLPEAVEESFFKARRSEMPGRSVGGVVLDEASQSFSDSVRGRISRIREDVSWSLFHQPPRADDLARIDVWVDFGGRPDFDGFIPEAIVAGAVVVATRNPLNERRLKGGEAGFLVPPEDPNEMAHVILSALFKPELAEPRRDAAVRTRDRFAPAARAKALRKLYASVAP